MTINLTIPGAMGPRAWDFAFKVAISMRWQGDLIGEHRIVVKNERDMLQIAKLQERDVREGLV